MNAGNLNISVEADMKALDAQFAKLETAFVESGKRAAAAFQQATGTLVSGPAGATDTASKIAEEFAKASEKSAAAFAKAGEKAGAAFKSQMEAQIKTLPKAVETTVATAVADSVGKKAGARGGLDFGNEFGKRSASLMKTFAGPMIASTLANTVAGIIRSEKPLNEAILDGIKTIPFIGAFANLGQAIYEETFGAADRAAQDLIDETEKARAGHLTFVEQRLTAEKQGQAAAGEMQMEQRRIEAQQRLNEVRMTGDQEAIARAEFIMFEELQALETALKMAQDTSDLEFNAFLQLGQAKRKIAQQEMELKLEAIEKQRQKEEEAANALLEKDMAHQDKLAGRASALSERESKKLREEQGKAAVQRMEDEIKFMDQQERDLKRLNDERANEQERFASEISSSARVGSVSTAIGEFKFSAYPEAEKRRMDQMALDALRGILNRIDAQVRTTQEATFA
jgi:hypothetical protein